MNILFPTVIRKTDTLNLSEFENKKLVEKYFDLLLKKLIPRKSISQFH